MCNYRVTKFRCNHKVKNTLLPCDLLPRCNSDHAALLDLTADLRSVRTAIRLHNSGPRNTAQYPTLLSRLRHDYRAFFGRASGHGGDVLASLRNLEGYLDEEIEAICTNVVERFRVVRFCDDHCWEAEVIREREEKEREEVEMERERRDRERGAWLRY